MRPGVIVRPSTSSSSAPSGRAISPPIRWIRPSGDQDVGPFGANAAAVDHAGVAQDQRCPLTVAGRPSTDALRVVVDPVPVELDAETRARRQVLVALGVEARAALPFTPWP